MNFKIMQELLSKKGIAIDSSLENKFNIYASSLIEWNTKMNLTSIKEESEIFEKHFFDCLLLMESFDFSNKFTSIHCYSSFYLCSRYLYGNFISYLA